MEIIILGFILFIVGVGATIIYDKHKDSLKDLSRIKESFGKRETLLQRDFAKIKSALTATVTKTTTTRKPISQKKKLKTTVTAEDGSINSSMTVDELIAKIEQMKKK
jgi:hypothetical protein